MFMKYTVQFHSLNLLYVTCPLLLIEPLLSLDSLQKVGFLARPAGGAVKKMGSWSVLLHRMRLCIKV